ncbi:MULTISPECIES: hypothetical protein [Sorangium]|uniref:4-vinyl reductase 4VR domain-containing protein n=1 Tax=Sorangium cellulosum (strain So ce56) TaxID=448385 RepID=A9GYE2_SORC5|nr:hypothetical protein [Sorangium cellulosum]CAN97226.1 hypothetical protein sce7057 [Sorangium cellulosum So ce56]
MTALRHGLRGRIDGPLGDLVGPIVPHGLLHVADQLVVAHSHHFALFLEQTIFDALGGESRGVRRQAAFEAAHALLGPLYEDRHGASPREKLELAGELFAAMGQGRLRFEVSAEGGAVHADSLFHGTSFLAKYGGRIQNRLAVDAFASGYCAAAASLAFPSDWGRLDADEVTCIARGDATCTFLLTRRSERPRFGEALTRKQIESARVRWETEGGPLSRAQRVEGAMLEELGALRSDERGLISAYGVNLALLPVGYIDQKTFDTVHLIERRSPELVPVFEALVREAAQTGAFHLLGGMLSSSSFEAACGPVGRDQHERLEQLLGLARALGWGALSAPEFQPGRALVLRAPITHESAYYAMKHGSTARARLLFQQGTALAIMQLLHRVDFGTVRPIDAETYGGLFKVGTRFRVQETKSPLRGDGACEVRVEAVEDRW